MSMLVDDNGCAYTYVVVNYNMQTILSAHPTVQRADKAVNVEEAYNKEDQFGIHNITHPKCLTWIIEQVQDDKEYCRARSNDFASIARTTRRQVTAILADADRYQLLANHFQLLADKWSALI